jgi:hypothetical protein
VDGVSLAVPFDLRLGTKDVRPGPGEPQPVASARIDDGSLHEPPHVYLGDDALSSAQARGLVAALLAVADEADRLVANSIGTD